MGGSPSHLFNAVELNVGGVGSRRWVNFSNMVFMRTTSLLNALSPQVKEVSNKGWGWGGSPPHLFITVLQYNPSPVEWNSSKRLPKSVPLWLE